MHQRRPTIATQNSFIFSTATGRPLTAQPDRHVTSPKIGGWSRRPGMWLAATSTRATSSWREIVVASALVALAGCVSFDVGRFPSSPRGR
jgi:hypothetical protein